MMVVTVTGISHDGRDRELKGSVHTNLDLIHVVPPLPRTEWEAARAAKASASNRNSRRRGKPKKDKTEEKFVSKVRDATAVG